MLEEPLYAAATVGTDYDQIGFPFLGIIQDGFANIGLRNADLEVQFAGQTTSHKQVPLHLTTQGNEAKISGTIPATLTDLKIDPPSLLSLPVKNGIPVRVEMTWRREK